MIEYKVISGSKFERQLKKLPKEARSFITEISEVQKSNPFPEEGIQNAVSWYLENKDCVKNVKV